MTKGEVDDLKSGTHRHRHRVLPLLMFCQASAAAVLSSCLILLHFPFMFIFSKWNTSSAGFTSGHWLGHSFFKKNPKNSGCFQFAWAHCPSASWSTIQPVLEHFAEYEQRMLAENLQNSSCSFCQQPLNIREPASLAAILTPLHHHLHSSLMRWYELDLEQLNPFSMLFFSHHSGTNWYLSHLSIGCCSRTKNIIFLINFKQTFMVLRLTNVLHVVVKTHHHTQLLVS